MPRYRLSSRAESDLAEIADYTIEAFGIEQARRYMDGLEVRFQTLADKPLAGGRADELAPEPRRVLHQSMDFQRHL